MITEMRVQRFRALKDVTVRLGKFNVLIGPNDSGKSSFLEAVYALAMSTARHINGCFWHKWNGSSLIHNRAETGIVLSAMLGSHDDERPISYELRIRSAGDQCTIDEERIDQTIVLQNCANSRVHQLSSGAQFDSPHHPLLEKVVQRLRPASLTRWDVEELGKPSHLPPDRQQPFDATGYGLSTCLGELKLYDDEAFRSVCDEFTQRFPEFQSLSFRRTSGQGWVRDTYQQRVPAGSGDVFEMSFVRRDGVRIPADLASGGALVTLAFLTMAKLGGSLLLVEEPENGLHPERLQEVVRILRDASAALPDGQVIFTTHSPFVPDYVEPHEVRLFSRNEAGDVDVYDVADLPDIKSRLRFALLGEIIYGDWPGFLKELGANAHSGVGRGAE